MGTRLLLKSIGYPHKGESLMPHSVTESRSLYKLARKNKIGSLYVKSLADSNEIQELEKEWEARKEFQTNYRETLAKLGAEFPSSHYAIVKSTYPFWCDSKDIDILLFDDNLVTIQKTLQESGYELRGTSPTSADLIHPETGIQIDIQDGFSLQNVLYFDKDSLLYEVEEKTIDSIDVPVISPPGNLAVIVIHSITEQLFLLKEFYAAVFYLEQFTETEYNRFLDIVDENKLGPACSAFFSIVNELCKEVFNDRPPYIEQILKRYSSSKTETEILKKSNFKTPHRYSTRTGIRTIGSKLRHRPFSRSIITQIPHLLNPGLSYHIISQVLKRRSREHYMHDTSDIE